MQPLVISANEQILINPNWISQGHADLFNPTYWQQQGAVLGSATGRGTTWFVQCGDTPAALRHYYRGGLLGKVIRDQYWFTGWSQSRSFAEFALLAHLHQQGVAVPQPLAARVVKTLWWYRADILTEFIAGSQSLVERLQQGPLTAAQYRLVGAEIRKLHEAGVNHTDLNIHNILLDNTGKVWLIDFDKCQRQSSGAYAKANLERLKRSFLKEQTKRQIHWQELEFEALLSGYAL